MQLIRPGMDQMALGGWLTSRPAGHLQPMELWFSIHSCTCVLVHIDLKLHMKEVQLWVPNSKRVHVQCTCASGHEWAWLSM